MYRYGLNSALAGLAIASLPAPALALELEPKCPVEEGFCWIEVANRPGCHAWVQKGKTAHQWSGGCSDDLASGEGIYSLENGNFGVGTASAAAVHPSAGRAIAAPRQEGRGAA